MKEVITKIIQKSLEENKINLKKEEIEDFLEIPKDTSKGDFAFPCFFLAEKLKRNPHQIAIEIRSSMGEPLELSDIQTEGAYINFFVDRKSLAKNLVKQILKQRDNFGKNNLGKNSQIMIEFSQPNTHKAFHVGHIRGTSIGESISRVYEFCGNKIIRANYSGDTGMHIAKWIWCYQKYHPKEKLKNNEKWIASIYVDAVKRLSKNKNLQKQVDKINFKLGTKEDKELNNLWKKTRKVSIDSWKKIYKELDTFFDVYYFESEMEEKGIKLVDDLMKKGIAKLSEDAVIVDLKKYNLGVWVLLRKDKTVLYSLKDISLAQKKFSDFKLSNSIVFVAEEQEHHFKQLKKTLELMNFKHTSQYNFSPFGLVKLPHGKMSSRTGDNVLYSDFIGEITSHAKKEIKKRSKKISKKELEKRSLKISIAAIKYSMLKQSPRKIITFRKEEALNFEGDTGSYLIYSYARASSILRKAKITKEQMRLSKLEDKEIELVKKLSDFPNIVIKAYSTLDPSIIANYSYSLAKIFNEFYHTCPVINSEKEIFRLSLVNSFRQVLKNSLYLLGIETLEKM